MAVELKEQKKAIRRVEKTKEKVKLQFLDSFCFLNLSMYIFFVKDSKYK